MNLDLVIFVVIFNIKTFINAASVKWHLPCTGNEDCRYAYICDEGYCQEVREISQIMSKQKCPSIFKQKCEKDDHCYCDEHQLVCRQGECNYPNNRPQVIDCKTHYDCNGAELCENYRCREAVTFEELDMLLHFHRCSSERECTPGFQCIDGNCMKVQAIG